MNGHSRSIPFPFIFALLFSTIFFAHLPLLRLPYYWDEAGYYIPAAHDLLQSGRLIPSSIPSNAHPPLVMVWLALWWKFSGVMPAVTRIAMLIFAALALAAVYRLARLALNTQVALAATICAAVYPVFFAQSSLAHVDMAAAAFGLWGVAMFIEDRPIASVVAFLLAVLAKETAIVVPVALALWELIWPIARQRGAVRPALAPCRRPYWQTFALLLGPAVVLAAWYVFHFYRTGFVFGNPEFFRYNVSGTLHPTRILLACLRRLWQVTGYMNLFVLTGAAALAMMLPPLPEGNAGAGSSAMRPRIAPRIQAVFAIVVLAHVIVLSFVGGAVLARYMLMPVPMVIVLCVSTLRRRVRGWPLLIVGSCAAFVLALFVNPSYRFAMEDNLAYCDYVLLHKAGADFLSSHQMYSRVLTAWPASDELAKPYLGYVKTAIPVVPLENFSLPEIARAAHDRSLFDVAYVFSTKYEAPSQSRLIRWWERLQEPYFDYHRDLRPEAIAQELGGRIVWQWETKAQWVAIIVPDRNQDAELSPRQVVAHFRSQRQGFPAD